jgi:hypothetical protein
MFRIYCLDYLFLYICVKYLEGSYQKLVQIVLDLYRLKLEKVFVIRKSQVCKVLSSFGGFFSV